MTSVDENRFFFSAWGISLTLHGVVVILSLQFVEHVKPVLPESLFKWDVALFEDARSEFKSLPADSVLAQAQPPAKKAPPSQLKRVSEISKAVTPIEQESVSLPPKIEAVQPSEQKKEIPQLRQESVEGRTADVAQPDADRQLKRKSLSRWPLCRNRLRLHRCIRSRWRSPRLRPRRLRFPFLKR